MSNQALYLQWRPQLFDDVIGQEHIITTLQNSLRQDRMRHAYLFSGPRGTGKTTTARLIAKAVNCTHPDVNRRPCDECAICVSTREGRSLDLIEIDAASHTGVDDVRELRDKIAFAPSVGQYKVYIIDEVHRFSGAAFDALLKTLEEPPPHAIFVLATTEIDKVPATIKSRCLLFEFRRVPLRMVMERLQQICDNDGVQIDPEALELIARQGTGSVRDSISLLDQVVADPSQYITLEIAQHMLGAIGSQSVQKIVQAVLEQESGLALEMLNQALDMGADPRQLGQQIVDHLRQILLVKVGGQDLVDASDNMRMMLAEQAELVNRKVLLKALRTFNAALADMRGGWQPQLPLELAIVESSQPLVEEPVVVAAAASLAAPKRTAAPQPIAANDAHETPEPMPRNISDIRAAWQYVLESPHLDSPSKAKLKGHVQIVRVTADTITLGTTKAFVSGVETMINGLAKIIRELTGQGYRVQVVEIEQGRPQAHDEFEALGLELGGVISPLEYDEME